MMNLMRKRLEEDFETSTHAEDLKFRLVTVELLRAAKEHYTYRRLSEETNLPVTVLRLIEKMKIHEKMIEVKDLDYDKYFSKEDTNLFVEIVLRNICSYRIDKDLKNQFEVLLKSNEEGSILVFPII